MDRENRVAWLKEHRGTVGVLAQMVADHEERIAELEAMVRSQKAMLDEIASAAGFGLGDAYSAAAIIGRLKHG